MAGAAEDRPTELISRLPPCPGGPMLTPGNRTAPVSGVLRFHFFLPQAPGRGRVESRLTEVLMSNSRIHSFVAAAACVAVVALTAGQAAIKYPQTRKGDQVDSYGGVTVQDPYR